MAHITADRVKDTTVTTGTGNITLANSAPTGFRTLDAVAATSDTFFYALELSAEWEVGLGTYSGSHVFVRTTVLASSNGGAAVNFSAGTKNFFTTLAAGQFRHRQGAADAATAVAQVLELQSVVAGTTNGAGADRTSILSLSTGSGVAGGDVIKAGFAGKGAATATVTMTIATPCVVTWTAHGFGLGQKVVLTTTGALPTGLAVDTTYYAAPTGVNTFNLATSMANAEAGTVIATTGSQSGTHTGTTLATTQNEAGTIATFGPRSLTGAQVIPALDLKQTWNTSGVAIGLRLNVNNIGSNGRLLDLQVNGTTVFYVGNGGFSQLLVNGNNAMAWGSAGTTIAMGSGYGFGWASNASNTTTDASLARDGAAAIGLRGIYGGSNGKFRVYQAYTDLSNYERLTLQGGSGYFELAAETAGTGTDNLDLRLTAAGTGKVSTVGSFAIGTTGDYQSLTINQASANPSNLPFINLPGVSATVYTKGGFFSFNSQNSGIHVVGSNASLRLGQSEGAASDLCVFRDAADTWAQRRTTAAQKHRVYRTWTDASNYERLALQSGAGYFELAAETAGTGTDDIDIRLTPAGAGLLRFGAHSAIASEVITGYITIKDAAGNTRKLAVVS